VFVSNFFGVQITKPLCQSPQWPLFYSLNNPHPEKHSVRKSLIAELCICLNTPPPPQGSGAVLGPAGCLQVWSPHTPPHGGGVATEWFVGTQYVTEKNCDKIKTRWIFCQTNPPLSTAPVRFFRALVSDPGGCAFSWILTRVANVYFL